MSYKNKNFQLINNNKIVKNTSTDINITKNKAKCKLFNTNFNNLFLNIVSILLIVITIMLVCNPIKYMSSVISGLKLFFYAVVPSLLPFLFLSKLLTELKTIDKLSNRLKKPIKFLFNTPPITSYVFLMSIICGYPVGAKLIGDLYENKKITTKEAKSMFAICSTSGPIFVIGAVGAGLLNDTYLGVLIFLSHIISSVICGLIFADRKIKSVNKNLTSENTNINSEVLSKSINSTISSILTIAVYVSIFYMFIDIAYDLKILGASEFVFSKILKFVNIDINFAKGLSSGLIEMTRGCAEISTIANKKIQLILCSGLISFSGLSIIIQSLTFLSKTKINAFYVLSVKCVQSLISILIAIVFTIFI